MTRRSSSMRWCWGWAEVAESGSKWGSRRLGVWARGKLPIARNSLRITS